MAFQTDQPHQEIRVSSIEVRGLFGRLSYHLDLDSRCCLRRMAILYGENGSGKTTILNLVFRLLSAEENAGHKTYIGTIPFRHIAVRLNTGFEVVASRPTASDGPYSLEIRSVNHPSMPIALVDFDPERQRRNSDSFDRLLMILRDISPRMFYLRHDRDIWHYRQSAAITSYMELGESSLRTHSLFADAARALDAADQYLGSRGKRASSDLDRTEIAMSQCSSWMLRKIFEATKEGQSNSDQAYLEVAKGIVSLFGAQELVRPTKADVMSKLEMLTTLEERMELFGLKSGSVAKHIVSLLREISGEPDQRLLSLLVPFVDALQKRLESLREIQSLIATFLENANSFLRDKMLRFDPSRGLSIYLYGSDQELSASNLSSGERHLVTMLSYGILSNDAPTVFLIDEPELSLSIRWQRDIISALMNCTDAAGTQFIAASHSLPLLTEHRDNVIDVDNSLAD
ncbi:MAG: AAA family ATPase [Phycisphaerales bacterium]|nr:AAA family ATPase [Phycisphaerales bacterium]